MAIKNIRSFDKLHATPYDVSINKQIEKAKAKGKIHTIKPSATISNTGDGNNQKPN